VRCVFAVQPPATSMAKSPSCHAGRLQPWTIGPSGYTQRKSLQSKAPAGVGDAQPACTATWSSEPSTEILSATKTESVDMPLPRSSRDRSPDTRAP
jgi:hypothetical protein